MTTRPLTGCVPHFTSRPAPSHPDLPLRRRAAPMFLAPFPCRQRASGRLSTPRRPLLSSWGGPHPGCCRHACTRDHDDRASILCWVPQERGLQTCPCVLQTAPRPAAPTLRPSLPHKRCLVLTESAPWRATGSVHCLSPLVTQGCSAGLARGNFAWGPESLVPRFQRCRLLSNCVTASGSSAPALHASIRMQCHLSCLSYELQCRFAQLCNLCLTSQGTCLALAVNAPGHPSTAVQLSTQTKHIATNGPASAKTPTLGYFKFPMDAPSDFSGELNTYYVEREGGMDAADSLPGVFDARMQDAKMALAAGTDLSLTRAHTENGVGGGTGCGGNVLLPAARALIPRYSEQGLLRHCKPARRQPPRVRQGAPCRRVSRGRARVGNRRAQRDLEPAACSPADRRRCATTRRGGAARGRALKERVSMVMGTRWGVAIHCFCTVRPCCLLT
jgi:hypothetical protein